MTAAPHVGGVGVDGTGGGWGGIGWSCGKMWVALGEKFDARLGFGMG